MKTDTEFASSRSFKTQPLSEFLGIFNLVPENEVGVRQWIQVNNNPESFEEGFDEQLRKKIFQRFKKSKPNTVDWAHQSIPFKHFPNIVTKAEMSTQTEEKQCFPKNDQVAVSTPKFDKAINAVVLSVDKATETDEECHVMLKKDTANVHVSSDATLLSPTLNKQEYAAKLDSKDGTPVSKTGIDVTDSISNSSYLSTPENVLAPKSAPPVPSPLFTAPMANEPISPYNPNASTFKPSQLYKFKKAQEWEPKNEDERKAFEQLKSDVFHVLVVNKGSALKYLTNDYRRIVQEPLNLESAGIPGMKTLLVQMTDLIYLKINHCEDFYVFPKLSGKAYETISHVEELVAGQRDTNIRFPVPNPSTLLDCDFRQLFKEPYQQPETPSFSYQQNPYYDPRSGLFRNPYQQYNNNDLVYRTPHQRQSQLQQQQQLLYLYNLEQKRLQSQQQQPQIPRFQQEQSQEGLLPNPNLYPFNQYHYNLHQNTILPLFLYQYKNN